MINTQRQNRCSIYCSQRLAPCVSTAFKRFLTSHSFRKKNTNIAAYYMSKVPRHLACCLGPPGWLRRKNCLPVKRSLHAEEARASWTQLRFFLPSFLLFLSAASLCLLPLLVVYFSRARASSCFDPRRSRDVHLLLIEPWMVKYRVATIRISESIIDTLKSKYKGF